MKLTGKLYSALAVVVAVVALGYAAPFVMAPFATVATDTKATPASTDLAAVQDPNPMQTDQDKCVTEADGDESAACLSAPGMHPGETKPDITPGPSSKACLMEGHYVVRMAGGVIVNQKQCFENHGVAEDDFKRTCEGLMEVAMWAAGDGSHKLTYMASCPPNPTSMCKRLFEQPVIAYYYKGSDEQAGALCREPVTL